MHIIAINEVLIILIKGTFINFVFIIDCDEDTMSHALVQYTFDGEEHQVFSRPHGNSKKSEGYVRTCLVRCKN